jgi:hypothetical protein
LIRNFVYANEDISLVGGLNSSRKRWKDIAFQDGVSLKPIRRYTNVAVKGAHFETVDGHIYCSIMPPALLQSRVTIPALCNHWAFGFEIGLTIQQQLAEARIDEALRKIDFPAPALGAALRISLAFTGVLFWVARCCFFRVCSLLCDR